MHHYGIRLFGKIDAVPGMFHVATEFAHFDYIPLFPLSTVLVLTQEGKKGAEIKIPLSLKSVAIVWGRAAAIVGTAVGVIGSVNLYGPGHTGAESTQLTIGIASLFFLFCSYNLPFFKRASWKRACHLAKFANLPAPAWHQLAAAYGRPVPAEAICDPQGAAG